MQTSRLLGSTIPAAASDSISKPESLNKDDFLKLLMTQMQHQDPLSPLDNTEFLSQLSQFSQLEQIYNVNQSIQDLKASQNSTSNMLLASLLGKTAKVDASYIYLKDQSPISLNYDLVNSVDTVTVNISDADGTIVKTFKESQQKSGHHTVDWDGEGENKKSLPNGEYKVEIITDNLSEGLIGPYLSGPVQEVIFTQGGSPLIQVEGQSVPVSRILQVSSVSDRALQPGCRALLMPSH